MNTRYHFQVNVEDLPEKHSKYGADPAEALFRYQLETLKSNIQLRVFKTRKLAKKTSPS